MVKLFSLCCVNLLVSLFMKVKKKEMFVDKLVLEY